LKSEFIKKSVYFDLTSSHVKSLDADRFEISLTVNGRLAGTIRRVHVRTTPDNEELLTPMLCDSGADKAFWIYKAVIRAEKEIENLRFRIAVKNSVFWFNARGVFDYEPGDHEDFKFFRENAIPKWVAGAVFYQIFPDRFHHGMSEKEYDDFGAVSRRFFELYGISEKNGHERRPALKKWGEEPGEKDPSREFYFGTLEGVAKKAGHLKKLGITAVYITPILKAPSCHRYDVEDYFTVDPVLGGEKAFARMVEKLRKLGIRLLFDAVFNHSGSAAGIFRMARRGVGPYSNFYTFRSKDKSDYACWLGHKSLPKFDYSSDDLKKYIYSSKRSVAARWLDPATGADGLRLDAAQMIGMNGSAEGNIKILKEMKSCFKKYNPEAFVLAENFFDPDAMINGGAVDSAMNYHGFTFPLRDFFSGTDRKGDACRADARTLAESLAGSYSKIPQACADAMLNLLSSHDIPRFRSIVGGRHSAVISAFALMFAYPGLPCVYYGEEVGLGSGTRCERDAMIWDEEKWDLRILNALKKLSAIRKKNAALTCGGLRFIFAKGRTIAFMRKYEGISTLFILNDSRKTSNTAFSLEDIFINAGSGFKFEILFDSSVFNETNKRTVIKIRGGFVDLSIPHESSAIISFSQRS